MGMTVRVPVSASIWNWVTKIGSFQSLTDDDYRKIERWQAGESAPTINQLSQFSKKLRIPVGYFFLDQPINDVPPVCAHRTIANAAITEPSRELVDTLTDMQSVQEWIRQDIVECGEGKLPFVGSYQVGQAKVAELADAIRGVLQLSVEWYLEDGRVMPVDEAFKFLRERCTDSGIVVMLNGVARDNTHRPLNVQEFRAFALVDEYAPLIFINRTDSRHGQIFSLAHEIVHVWLGAEEIYNDSYQYESNAPIEVLCNAVAAELLVPRTIFARHWRRIVEERSADDAVEELAERFPVSQVVIARRALDEGFISFAKYQDVVAACRRHWEDQRSSASGGNYYSTKRSRLDYRFVERLAASVSEGRTSYTDAYRLTGTNRKTFSNILKPMEVW
mgnify:CR=1 FL=1